MSEIAHTYTAILSSSSQIPAAVGQYHLLGQDFTGDCAQNIVRYWFMQELHATRCKCLADDQESCQIMTSILLMLMYYIS